jgi:hypothetical protein
MASADRVRAAKDRLAREGIEVTVHPAGEILVVHVVRSSWSEPHTWLTVFLEFLAINYCVKIC